MLGPSGAPVCCAHAVRRHLKRVNPGGGLALLWSDGGGQSLHAGGEPYDLPCQAMIRPVLLCPVHPVMCGRQAGCWATALRWALRSWREGGKGLGMAGVGGQWLGLL